MVTWIAQVELLLGTGWKVRGYNSGTIKRSYFLYNRPDRIWGPISFLFSRYQNSFPRTEQSRREVDYSPPSSAEIKNEWSYASIPPIRLHGVNRDHFIFYVVWNYFLTDPYDKPSNFEDMSGIYIELPKHLDSAHTSAFLWHQLH